jgi:hypothetical protein
MLTHMIDNLMEQKETDHGTETYFEAG